MNKINIQLWYSNADKFVKLKVSNKQYKDDIFLFMKYVEEVKNKI